MKEIILPAKPENIEIMTDSINEFLEENGVSMKVTLQIDVAIDEILSNIAYYAYVEREGDMGLKAEMIRDNTAVRLVFSDKGIPFDPLKKEDPDVTLSAEERKIGGLGIFMVKKTMDAVFYERKQDMNILTIEKNI